MDLMMIFGSQFLLSMVVVSLLAKWHVAPWLAGKSSSEAMSLLLVPHTFRHLGLVFLVPGLVGDQMPSSFARAAAFGDLLSGLLALLAVAALRNKWQLAMPLAGLFNVVGSVDLIYALSQASVVPQLGVSWFIPTFVVPVLLVTHAMIFARLFSRAHVAPDVSPHDKQFARSASH